MTRSLIGCRVLVVEDEMLVLMDIEAALVDLGCSTILAAASVSQALVLLDGNDFDVAMLDVKLANEMSYPVADALARRGIPFAFSTGCSDHNLRKDLGDRPVLRKPYVQAHLESVLSQLVIGNAASTAP